MIELNKTPMANPDVRFFWWQDYSDFLKKIASNLEDELYDNFRFNQFNEQPDVDAPIAKMILDGLYQLADVAQNHTNKLRKPLELYDKFCDYWVHGNGEWHGLQEFLQQHLRS